MRLECFKFSSLGGGVVKVKYQFDILAFGAICSWILVFIALFVRSLSGQGLKPMSWFYLAAGIVIWLHKIELDKPENIERLVQSKENLLIINLVTCVFAFFSLVLALDSLGSEELLWFSVALGLPSIGALLWYAFYTRFADNGRN